MVIYVQTMVMLFGLVGIVANPVVMGFLPIFPKSLPSTCGACGACGEVYIGLRTWSVLRKFSSWTLCCAYRSASSSAMLPSNFIAAQTGAKRQHLRQKGHD